MKEFIINENQLRIIERCLLEIPSKLSYFPLKALESLREFSGETIEPQIQPTEPDHAVS